MRGRMALNHYSHAAAMGHQKGHCPFWSVPKVAHAYTFFWYVLQHGLEHSALPFAMSAQKLELLQRQ